MRAGQTRNQNMYIKNPLKLILDPIISCISVGLILQLKFVAEFAYEGGGWTRLAFLLHFMLAETIPHCKY